MYTILVVVLLLSIAVLIYAISSYFFTEKINEVNKKIFNQFTSFESNLLDIKSLEPLKNSIELTLEKHIQSGLIYGISIKKIEQNRFNIYYNIKGKIRHALVTFDLVRKVSA